jgi:rhodanese-related sulfurtransferase
MRRAQPAASKFDASQSGAGLFDFHLCVLVFIRFTLFGANVYSPQRLVAAYRHQSTEVFMLADVPFTALPEELASIKAAAEASGLPFAGGVPPATAWQLFSTGRALLVDVRTGEERKFVGHVPDTLHVAWATGTALTRNPRFVRELESKIGGKDAVALLLCRSGKRSALAAEAAAKAGFSNIFNILEGFEGELDAQQRRGKADGWRFHGLPWVQD